MSIKYTSTALCPRPFRPEIRRATKSDQEHPLTKASAEDVQELKKNIHKVTHGILKPVYDMVKEIIEFTKKSTEFLVNLAKQHRDLAASSEFLGGAGAGLT